MILFNHIHVIGIQLHVTPSKSRVMDQDRSHVTESDRFGDLPVAEPLPLRDQSDKFFGISYLDIGNNTGVYLWMVYGSHKQFIQ